METIPSALATWIIGILISVVAFFIVRSFNSQSKKDEKQDEQIEKISQTLDAMRQVATDMRLMIQKHDSEISFLMKNAEKAVRR